MYLRFGSCLTPASVTLMTCSFWIGSCRDKSRGCVSNEDIINKVACHCRSPYPNGLRPTTVGRDECLLYMYILSRPRLVNWSLLVCPQSKRGWSSTVNQGQNQDRNCCLKRRVTSSELSLSEALTQQWQGNHPEAVSISCKAALVLKLPS